MLNITYKNTFEVGKGLVTFQSFMTRPLCLLKVCTYYRGYKDYYLNQYLIKYQPSLYFGRVFINQYFRFETRLQLHCEKSIKIQQCYLSSIFIQKHSKTQSRHITIWGKKGEKLRCIQTIEKPLEMPDWNLLYLLRKWCVCLNF